MVEEQREFVDITRPRFDQSTYIGRCQHFFRTTNPLNVFATSAALEEARKKVLEHQKNVEQFGRDHKLTRNEAEDIWKAKTLFDSAFHPDTGQKMPLIGRMSAQVPMNMSITGCMLTFYSTTPQVIFWQWINQSFNALVNFSNRSGNSEISTSTMGASYVGATAGALTTALSLNSIVKRLPPSAPAVLGRLVPFASVCAANSINIPMMRSQELINGMSLFTAEGEKIGESTVAAREGISKVVLSRVLMAAPGMLVVPFAVQHFEGKPNSFLKRYPRSSAPFQILLCGLMLTFATPMCCALFSQQAAIPVSKIEPELQRVIAKHPNSTVRSTTQLFYNKGL